MSGSCLSFLTVTECFLLQHKCVFNHKCAYFKCLLGSTHLMYTSIILPAILCTSYYDETSREVPKTLTLHGRDSKI